MSVTSMPAYLELHRSGELRARAGAAWRLFDGCRVCPRHCGVDRPRGETGFCGLGVLPRVSSHLAHFGEEPPLTGTRGAGTIFFSSCNLACRGCQNWQISKARHGREETPRALADRMLDLQRRGCHNLDLVSPSHIVPPILAALDLAAADGLRLPVVYNSNAYDDIETLRLLDGVVDVYLPDAKYSSDPAARLVSRTPRATPYVETMRRALVEMRRQVGARLRLDEQGVARRGMIVRLLILPGDLAGVRGTLAWIAEVLGTGVCLSVMSQYSPYHEAVGHPLLGRRITAGEYSEVVETLVGLGFESYFLQGFESRDACVPNFERTQPFAFDAEEAAGMVRRSRGVLRG